LQRRNKCRFVSAVLLFSSAVVLVAATPACRAQAEESATTRACSANPVLASSAGKKKSSRKPKNPSTEELAPVCIEIKGQAVEVQEFLQNTARKELWRIGENRASDDTWSFVRYLDADELDQFANTKVLIEPVNFSNGKAALVVRTSDLGGGYVRVQITAHFQGEGHSTDKVSAQPGNVWPLNSKGVLEQDLLKALESGYKPME